MFETTVQFVGRFGWIGKFLWRFIWKFQKSLMTVRLVGKLYLIKKKFFFNVWDDQLASQTERLSLTEKKFLMGLQTFLMSETVHRDSLFFLQIFFTPKALLTLLDLLFPILSISLIPPLTKWPNRPTSPRLFYIIQMRDRFTLFLITKHKLGV